jgi:hypothetical protein
MAATVAPLQTMVLLPAIFTVGVGFTVMLMTLVGAPVHPLAEGVTVRLAVIGALVVLVPVKLVILPFPLPTKPIAVLSLVQV